MKKFILSTLLAAVMIVALVLGMSLTVSAEEYERWGGLSV